MQVLPKLIRFARKSPREQLQFLRDKWVETEWYWNIHPGKDRTAYVIGLFGSGRQYVTELMLQNIGERTRYLRQTIRFHARPTSMIYSGHATIKYVSGGQALPAVTSRILEAVKSGFADLIFLYRHPLDSLLTNWITISAAENWRDGSKIFSISQVYKNADELCAGLEQNFSEFKAFADGDHAFWKASPGLRFLSFPEFVEETEIYLQTATLTLRFEDFTINPLKEFSKIAEVMSVNLDLSRLRVVPPRTKPYGYLAVKERVPRFRNFINELDAETKRRIEQMGYSL
jgi:hypothetical protein